MKVEGDAEEAFVTLTCKRKETEAVGNLIYHSALSLEQFLHGTEPSTRTRMHSNLMLTVYGTGPGLSSILRLATLLRNPE